MLMERLSVLHAYSDASRTVIPPNFNRLQGQWRNSLLERIADEDHLDEPILNMAT
jgi:hypothetical protein